MLARTCCDTRGMVRRSEVTSSPAPSARVPGHTHPNVKRLVALAAGWDREDGMAGAMRRLGVEPLPGSRHHRGCDDAVEIARLLGMLLRGARG